MTPRFVAGLAVAAMLSAGIAAAAYIQNHRSPSTAGAGERLLPDLVQKANEVAEITVTSASGSLALRAKDGEWVIADSGYPADRGKVADLVVQLAQLTRIEPKTDNPGKYALLEVEAPDKPTAKGRLVTLKDAGGATIGEVILGKHATGQTVAGRDAQYVRFPSEPASWLVQGAVDAGPEIGSFADTTLLSLAGADIVAARFRQPDGAALEIRRGPKGEDGSTTYEVANLPEGAKLKTEADARSAVMDLASVSFIGVRPRKAESPTSSEVEVETEKGLKLGFKLVEEGGKPWLSVDVLAPGSDQTAADAIAAKVKGWEFQVTDTKAKQLKRTLADLVQSP